MLLGSIAVSCSNESASTPATTPGLTGTTGTQVIDLRTAATKMATATNFKFRAEVTIAGSTQIIDGEFSAPDRVHQVLHKPDGTATELLIAGTRKWAKDPKTNAWKENTTTGSTVAPASTSDPRSYFRILQDATEVTRAGNDYSFLLRDAAAKSWAPTATSIRGVATLSGGAISVLTFDLSQPPTHVRLTYDTNADVQVTVPS